jgi:uncharacterized membrane protein
MTTGLRKTLDAAALLLLLFIWGITAYAIRGPHPLPARIPAHFDSAGRPDAWGAPAMLWMMPVIVTGVCLLMSLVARYPSSFRFSGRPAPAARAQHEAIALSMLSWLKVEIAFLFAVIQYWTIQIVRQGQGRLSPAFMPLMLLAVFGTIAWHISALRRSLRSR